jgi:hypothetical protein
MWVGRIKSVWLAWTDFDLVTTQTNLRPHQPIQYRPVLRSLKWPESNVVNAPQLESFCFLNNLRRYAIIYTMDFAVRLGLA